MALVKDIQLREMASAYVVASFDEGKKILEEAGYRIISLEENARLRMQKGNDAYVSLNGNWVRENVIYVLNKGKYLTKKSPIIANAGQATNCHRNGKDFYLTDGQVEECLTDSVLLSLDKIPVNRFGDDDITAYVFGEYAREYGEFLGKAGITEMPIWTTNTDLQDKSFVRPVWFCGLIDYFELNCYSRCLCTRYGVRGVKDSA
jgi:hypothetical protein